MSRPQPPEDVVEALRAICAPLPGAREHQAWTGRSWRVAGTTFAHVVQIDGGWPPAYAAAFGTAGPATVVTFQVDSDERAALAEAGPPFHLPPWRPGIVGLTIDGGTEWRELAELVADSHRLCGMPRRRGRPGRR